MSEQTNIYRWFRLKRPSSCRDCNVRLQKGRMCEGYRKATNNGFKWLFRCEKCARIAQRAGLEKKKDET